jgi:hypothetical protein
MCPFGDTLEATDDAPEFDTGDDDVPLAGVGCDELVMIILFL